MCDLLSSVDEHWRAHRHFPRCEAGTDSQLPGYLLPCTRLLQLQSVGVLVRARTIFPTGSVPFFLTAVERRGEPSKLVASQCHTDGLARTLSFLPRHT